MKRADSFIRHLLVNNQRGIALMMVVWILVLLTALGTEFALSIKTEVNATMNYKEDFESYYLAKAGINLAMAEILKKVDYHAFSEETGFIFGSKPEKEGEEGVDQNSEEKTNKVEPLTNKVSIDEETESESESVIEPVVREDIPLGNGTITYSIKDENSKININTASRSVLVKALTASGLEIGELRDTIADSILDWIDPDSKHRLNGAETFYYKTQSTSYKAKNGPLDSVEELIKVRGVTEEILYGSEQTENVDPESAQYLGLVNYFTTQNIGNFNPNTAEPEMLEMFYSEQQIQEINEAIAEKGYYNNIKSTHFRIVSTGKLNDSKTRHTITAIIEKLGAGEKATLLIRYWNDNLIES